MIADSMESVKPKGQSRSRLMLARRRVPPRITPA